ncbi:hypothetical protein BKA70DRAFT_1270685 [Coprinopsis sp. MPI-PUGE-AT-0042]|nr:hypothetical protein BKA70DRAFT_1270685 [Coprinopsis sp. MPI-PUGE-AT-0042]
MLPFSLLILVFLLIPFEVSPHLPTALSPSAFPLVLHLLHLQPDCRSQSSKLVSRSFEARRISLLSCLASFLCSVRSLSPPRRNHLSSRSRCPRTGNNNLLPPLPFHWKDLRLALTGSTSVCMVVGGWVALWFGVGRSMHSARGLRFRRGLRSGRR